MGDYLRLLTVNDRDVPLATLQRAVPLGAVWPVDHPGMLGNYLAIGPEPNQLRSGRFIAAHRLDIEMEDKIGMGQTLEQLNCIGARGDKVGFGRR